MLSLKPKHAARFSKKSIHATEDGLVISAVIFKLETQLANGIMIYGNQEEVA